MSLSNTVIALDVLTGLIEVTARVNEILANARREGRDITDEELAVVAQQRRDVIKEALSK